MMEYRRRQFELRVKLCVISLVLSVAIFIFGECFLQETKNIDWCFLATLTFLFLPANFALSELFSPYSYINESFALIKKEKNRNKIEKPVEPIPTIRDFAKHNWEDF